VQDGARGVQLKLGFNEDKNLIKMLRVAFRRHEVEL
jgi:hypothetical protein